MDRDMRGHFCNGSGESNEAVRRPLCDRGEVNERKRTERKRENPLLAHVKASRALPT